MGFCSWRRDCTSHARLRGQWWSMKLTLFPLSFLDFLEGRKMAVLVLDLAPPADGLRSPLRWTGRLILFVCLCLLTAVPMPRTTIPVSPSRSKHCLYPVTAFPPNSRAFKPIFLRTWTAEIWRKDIFGQTHLTRQPIEEQLPGLITCPWGSYLVNPFVLRIIRDNQFLHKSRQKLCSVTFGHTGAAKELHTTGGLAKSRKS